MCLFLTSSVQGDTVGQIRYRLIHIANPSWLRFADRNSSLLASLNTLDRFQAVLGERSNV